MRQSFCIVTGATGSIGQAICKGLISNGQHVIATYRNPQKKEQLAAALGCSDLVQFELLQLDDPASIDQFFDNIKHLPIGALVNNAGVMNRRFHTATTGQEHTMAVNYYGTRRLTERLLPLIDQQQQGAIVFTTSVTRRLHRLNGDIFNVTEQNFSQLGTYGRSKLAITHYALYLATTLQGRVRVNCADPGVVNSDMITMHRWFDPLANVLFRPFISSPERGAQSALQALSSPLSGHIYHHAHHHPIGDEIALQPGLITDVLA